jgi:hypothetical protein
MGRRKGSKAVAPASRTQAKERNKNANATHCHSYGLRPLPHRQAVSQRGRRLIRSVRSTNQPPGRKQAHASVDESVNKRTKTHKAGQPTQDHSALAVTVKHRTPPSSATGRTKRAVKVIKQQPQRGCNSKSVSTGLLIQQDTAASTATGRGGQDISLGADDETTLNASLDTTHRGES